VRLAQSRPGHVHNDYLNVLVDWGVVGGVLGLGFLGLLAWGGVRTWKYVRPSTNDLSSGRSDRAAFVLGAAGALVFAGAHSVVEFNLYVPATAALAACLAGGLAGHLRYATSRHWYRVSWLALAGVSLVVVASGGFLGVQGWRMVREGRALTAAEERGIATATRLERLEGALAVEPGNYETLFAVGETWRLSSWRGNAGWEDDAWKAVSWFRWADGVNPFSPYNPLHSGMCLDWLGQTPAAERWYEEALRRDPKNYYVAAIRGWHAIQAERWTEARDWFQQSLDIKVYPNPIATRYLRIANRKIKESAP